MSLKQHPLVDQALLFVLCSNAVIAMYLRDFKVEATATQAIKVLVEGKVQGVYFRASTAKKATALGLVGWVRNLEDGRVEYMAQGLPDQLEHLLHWSKKGPVLARVVNVYHELASLDRHLCEFSVLR